MVGCDSFGLHPGKTSGRLYPVMEPAASERFAGSVLVGATPAMVAGTHPVAVAEAQMLLAPPQLGLNTWPERIRMGELNSQLPKILEGTPLVSQRLPCPKGNW